MLASGLYFFSLVLECLISSNAGFMLKRKRPACLNTQGKAKCRYLGSSDFFAFGVWGSPRDPFSVLERSIVLLHGRCQSRWEDGVEEEAKHYDIEENLVLWINRGHGESPPCITQIYYDLSLLPLSLVIQSPVFFMFMALWRNSVERMTTQLPLGRVIKVAKCKWISHFFLPCDLLSLWC